MAFEVRSNTGSALLTISRAAPKDRDGASDYVVTLQSGTLRASVGFYDLSLGPLIEALRRAAADWRGWEGERDWHSLEGEVWIRLAHDGLGTVGLLVRLVEARATPREWTAEALLEIDAGALDRVARNATTHLG